MLYSSSFWLLGEAFALIGQPFTEFGEGGTLPPIGHLSTLDGVPDGDAEKAFYASLSRSWPSSSAAAADMFDISGRLLLLNFFSAI